MRNKEQEQRKLILKEGAGENKRPVNSFENRFKFDFPALFSSYPRQEKKTLALTQMAKSISDQETYDSVKAAIENYRVFCEREKRPFAKILTFPSFWSEWPDWLSPDNGTSTINAAEGIDWNDEARIAFEAVKKFGPDFYDDLSKWLGEERMKTIKRMGGVSTIRQTKDDSYGRARIAGLLRDAFEAMKRENK